jgi:hypothetical protein
MLEKEAKDAKKTAWDSEGHAGILARASAIIKP